MTHALPPRAASLVVDGEARRERFANNSGCGYRWSEATKVPKTFRADTKQALA